MLLDDDQTLVDGSISKVYGAYRDQMILEMFQESFNNMNSVDGYSVVEIDFTVHFKNPVPCKIKEEETLVSSASMTVAFYRYEYLQMINDKRDSNEFFGNTTVDSYGKSLLVWKVLNNIGIKIHEMGIHGVDIHNIHNIDFAITPRKTKS